MMKNNHILPFLWLHGEDEATLRDMLQKIAQSNNRNFFAFFFCFILIEN